MINKIAIALLISSLSSISWACTKPSKPELPTADNAVLAQMVKAQKDVKKYMKLSEEYLACEKSNSRHDRMVDEMQLIGANFNSLVKSYKARAVASS